MTGHGNDVWIDVLIALFLSNRIKVACFKHTSVLSKVKALPYLTLCDHLQAGAVVRPHEAAGAGRVLAVDTLAGHHPGGALAADHVEVHEVAGGHQPARRVHRHLWGPESRIIKYVK